jgi:hypothetical protein
VGKDRRPHLRAVPPGWGETVTQQGRCEGGVAPPAPWQTLRPEQRRGSQAEAEEGRPGPAARGGCALPGWAVPGPTMQLHDGCC